jgi:hypothetical protein
MKILESHDYKLRFRIDFNSPIEYINNWNKIKKECEEGNNKYISNLIKKNCTIISNKNLPYLDRLEGGLGGESNNDNKQIRFRHEFNEKNNDNDIILYVINSDSKNEIWTYNELDDIIRSFTKVLSNLLKYEFIKGCIEMVNLNSLDDNYLDTDSDNDSDSDY